MASNRKPTPQDVEISAISAMVEVVPAVLKTVERMHSASLNAYGDKYSEVASRRDEMVYGITNRIVTIGHEVGFFKAVVRAINVATDIREKREGVEEK